MERRQKVFFTSLSLLTAVRTLEASTDLLSLSKMLVVIPGVRVNGGALWVSFGEMLSAI